MTSVLISVNMMVSKNDTAQYVERRCTVDTNILKSVLVRNGDNVAALAGKMGMSTAALYRRISGDTEFSAKEIRMFKQIYDLTGEEIDTIFFAN